MDTVMAKITQWGSFSLFFPILQKSINSTEHSVQLGGFSSRAKKQCQMLQILYPYKQQGDFITDNTNESLSNPNSQSL